jgi:hypothetical protein
MKYRLFAVAACLCGTVLAQTSSTSSSTDAPPRSPAVRRVSAGIALNFLGLPIFPTRSQGVTSTTPVASTIYTTNDRMKRFGYGVNAQIALTDYISLNGELLRRRAGYVMTSDSVEGVDNPNTIADERRFITRNENTSFRFYDLPITARVYTKDRYVRGTRAFFEGGLAWRRVSNIRSTVQTVVNAADPTTSNTPAVPAARTVRGFTAGFGVHAVDPIGIRVVPMVRYTRWMGESFNAFSTVMQRNQIDGGIAFTF